MARVVSRGGWFVGGDGSLAGGNWFVGIGVGSFLLIVEGVGWAIGVGSFLVGGVFLFGRVESFLSGFSFLRGCWVG